MRRPWVQVIDAFDADCRRAAKALDRCPDCPTRRPGEKPLRVTKAADGTLRERCMCCALEFRRDELRAGVRTDEHYIEIAAKRVKRLK